MLKKSVEILKKNPVLVISYFTVTIALFLLAILFLPDINKIFEISKEIRQNQSDPSMVDSQKVIEMLIAVFKLALFGIFACIIGVLFMAGYGSMVSEAVNEGKPKIRDLFSGIKANIKKVILSFLLFLAFTIGFGIVTSIISLPFSLKSALENNNDTQAVYNNQRITQAISYIIMIFAYPFVELWLPAIFMDKKDGVIVSMKKGMKLGVKNYKLLVVVTAAMMLPSLGVLVFIKDMSSIITSPIYYTACIYQAVIVPVVLVYLFKLYKENSNTLNLTL